MYMQRTLNLSGLAKTLLAILLSINYIYTMDSEVITVSKKFISMETIITMCKTLHRQIADDKFTPDVLIGLARGGLIPLGFLAGEASFNNRNARVINLQSYTDDNKKTKLHLTAPIHPEDYQSFSSILIIDDLTDSGESLAAVLKELKATRHDADIKTAVLFYKKCSKIKPDYYCEETSDWIVFPWEV